MVVNPFVSRNHIARVFSISLCYLFHVTPFARAFVIIPVVYCSRKLDITVVTRIKSTQMLGIEGEPKIELLGELKIEWYG